MYKDNKDKDKDSKKISRKPVKGVKKAGKKTKGKAKNGIDEKAAEALFLTEGREPEILALKKMGLTVAEIAKKIGISVSTLKRACRVNPNLQDVYACKEYRIEYVQTRLFLDFKNKKLSERGKLKYFEILLHSRLLDTRKRLIDIETAMKLNNMLPPDDRLEIDGVTEEDIDRVMQTLSKKGNREGGDRKFYEGQSDYEDHYEVVPKNNAIG